MKKEATISIRVDQDTLERIDDVINNEYGYTRSEFLRKILFYELRRYRYNGVLNFEIPLEGGYLR